MKVFLSWSGDRSKKIALIIFEWLRELIPSLEPWMSARSVQAGQWWVGELQKSMLEAECGILCLTTENLESPWILFEAGALMMAGTNTDASTKGRVIPLLFDLKKKDLKFPLAQFQAVEDDQQGFWELAMAANETLAQDQRQSKMTLHQNFQASWHALNASMQSVRDMVVDMEEETLTNTNTTISDLSNREILEQVLDKVRNLEPSQIKEEKRLDWEDYFIQGIHHANERNGRKSDREALYYYSMCIATLPDAFPPNDHARILTYRAAILKRLGRLDEAESDLHVALKLATMQMEVADTLYNLSGVLSLKGEKTGALDCLEQMAEIDPRRISLLPRDYFSNIWQEPRFLALRSECCHGDFG